MQISNNDKAVHLDQTKNMQGEITPHHINTTLKHRLNEKSTI